MKKLNKPAIDANADAYAFGDEYAKSFIEEVKANRFLGSEWFEHVSSHLPPENERDLYVLHGFLERVQKELLGGDHDR
jgi:hypothetical protein